MTQVFRNPNQEN